MALFNKKLCDICGGSMGLIIDNKAADGNFCHNCAHKLSPFFHGAKNSTLQQIQQQIAYREQNKQALNFFSPTKVIGNTTKVYIDEAKRKFVVSKKSDYKSENADIIDFSQVLSVIPDVKEHKKELYMKDSEGHNKSYNPPRYDYTYEFIIKITVNCQYFNEIKFELTDSSNRPKGRNTQEYMQYEQMANQIVTYLKGGTVQGGVMGGIGNAVGSVMGGTGGLGGVVGAVMGGMNNNGMGNMNAMNNGMGNMNAMNNGMGNMNGMNNGMGSMNGMNNGMGNMNGMNNNAMGSNGLGGIVGSVMGGANGGNVGGGLGGVVGAAMGALGLGTMGGQQNNMGYDQTNAYGQQNNMGYNQNNAYGQQNNMGYNQTNAYGQQNNMGYNQNNGFGQQNNMGYNQTNGFGQQNFGMGGFQWVCPNCGTTNTADYCQSCGRQKG